MLSYCIHEERIYILYKPHTTTMAQGKLALTRNKKTPLKIRVLKQNRQAKCFQKKVYTPKTTPMIRRQSSTSTKNILITTWF